MKAFNMLSDMLGISADDISQAGNILQNVSKKLCAIENRQEDMVSEIDALRTEQMEALCAIREEMRSLILDLKVGSTQEGDFDE